MGFFQNSLLVTLLGVTQGYSKYTTSKIQWGPCDDIEINSTIPYDCSDIRVPLDYTKPESNETLTLQLLRLPAVVQPSLGSIQLNFGGPGEAGRGSLVQLGATLQALSGGSYDLVAFDPRGTGNTIDFVCYENDIEMLTSLYEQQQLGNSSEVALGRQWAWASTEANRCQERAAVNGSLLSTAFVARDLMQVAEALEDDGLLRYWGFSYGTTLGATVAAMFADRIEQMVLDGVQNPHEYYHAHADFEEWTDSDKVFSAIFSGCVASPSNCAMALDSQNNNSTRTAAELEAAVWDILWGLKQRPLALGKYVLDYSTLKGFLTSNLYDAAGWPALAQTLALLLENDIPALTAWAEALFASSSNNYDAVRAAARTTYALMGIHCGERTARADSLEEILPSAERLFDTSRSMGDLTTLLTMVCAQWQIEPRERYEGSFDGVQTRNPVLFVGNTYDAHTPLVSARNVSAGFAGSVVLEVNGYGHSSLAAPSLCTIQRTSAYWLHGTLPEPGTVCEVDAPLYSNVTWGDVIQAAAGNSTSAPSLARRDVQYIPNVGRIFGQGRVW